MMFASVSKRSSSVDSAHYYTLNIHTQFKIFVTNLDRYCSTAITAKRRWVGGVGAGSRLCRSVEKRRRFCRRSKRSTKHLYLKMSSIHVYH